MCARWLTAVVMLFAPTALAAGDRKQDEKPAADKPLHVFRGTLNAKDPPDRVWKSPHKVHPVNLEAGKQYAIELRSKDFDAYLRLEDGKGKQLAEDDDGAGRTDARVLFAPKEGGVYRVIVTAGGEEQAHGAYTLTVRRATELDVREQKVAAVRAEGEKRFERGQYAEADRLFRQALALQRELYPEKDYPNGHPEVAANLSNLGVALHGQGKLDEARRHHEQALAIQKKTLPPNAPKLAESLHNLASVLRDQGKLDEARAHFEQALAVMQKALSPRPLQLAHTLTSLGGLLREQGRLDEARHHQERALAIREKALPPDHPDLAQSFNNLGVLLVAQGKPDEARPRLERALAIREKALQPNHPLVGLSLNNLAGVLRELGELEEALRHQERALAIFQKSLPPGHYYLAHSLNELGNVQGLLGKLEDAGQSFGKARAIWEKALGPDHPDVAISLGNLGVMLQKQGKLEEALRHHEQARAIWEKALPPDNPDLARILSHLGIVLQQLKRPAQAWDMLAAAAATSARHAALVAPGSAQAEHEALSTRPLRYLEVLLSAAAEADGLSAAQRLELMARAHDSRALSAAVLLRRHAILASADPDAQALGEKLLSQRRRLADLLLQGPGPRDPRQHRKDCVALQQEADGLERELAQRLKPFADLAKAQRASPAEVAERLPGGAVLVELLRYDPFRFEPVGKAARRGAPRYAALLLWTEGAGKASPQARLVDLGAAAPLEKSIAAWRAAVQQGTADAKAERALRELLWAPLAKALPEKTARLVIAPGGALALVPFEAIKLDDGKYLIERYAVRYVSTGRDLMPLPLPKDHSDAALVLADPDYNRAEGGPAVKVVAGDDKLRAGLEFKRLPGFAKEADAVVKLLQGQKGWRVEQARGADASEEKLSAVKRPRLLHCVTHGFFFEDLRRDPPKDLFRDLEVVSASRSRLPNFGENPRLRSGLALTGANKWQERSKKGLSDGLLTALEVQDLDLWGTELVVLSACETGRGEIHIGEGVMGLRRAFQLAGAQTVLASLWKVPDDETEQLMTDTLSRWLKGAPPAEALRAAQLAMIERLRASPDRNRQQAPPLYWAGFVCHGR